MSRIITPTHDDVRKWGCLAYVDEKERKRIMDAPCGDNKNEIKRLEREIAEMKKKSKKR